MYNITKKQREIGTLRAMLRAMLQRQESWEMLPLWKKREECRSGSERTGYKRFRPPAGDGWCAVPDGDTDSGVGRVVLLWGQSSRRAMR